VNLAAGVCVGPDDRFDPIVEVPAMRISYARNPWTYILLVVGVGLLGASAFALLARDSNDPVNLTMTAGSLFKTRHRLALHICEDAKSRDLSIEVVESAGSVEAIDLLESGEVDLALVQGGIGLDGHAHIRQLATLYVEPLHLLVKEPLEASVSANLVNLAGHSIDISKPGSGTYLLATQVLGFAGLRSPRGNQPGDYLTVAGDYQRLLEKLARIDGASEAQRQAVLAELPDAIFLIGAVPSQMAGQLVEIAGYRLIPLPFGDAFSLTSVEEATDDHDRIAQAFIHSTQIPAYAYSVDPPVPRETSQTLGTRLLLIARDDVPDEAVGRLCAAVYEGRLQRLYDFPTFAAIAPEYELHPGAVAYRDRDKPVIRAELIEFVQSVFSVLGPAVGGLLALYGFVRWRQTLRFQHYLHEICRIQRLATGRAFDPALPPDLAGRMTQLESRLDDLQQQAVAEFAKRYFHGEGVMEILLALLSDVRGTLHRLMDEPTNSLRGDADPPAGTLCSAGATSRSQTDFDQLRQSH
jgi:TRAP-type uncharacterized transport system substrate-binding protein